jgi:lycopene elongase/hydratase (dihydrobisanhydrobacterioruberin-forming)
MILISSPFSITLLMTLKDPTSLIIFSSFLFLSLFYSAPPLRLKTKPYLDFASNFLYILPGFLGYYQTSHHLPNFNIFIATFCWTSAMHLFSAIPDIESDKKAGLKTTAVILKEKSSLILCSLFWLMTANVVLMNEYLGATGVFTLIYPLIPLLIYYHKITLNKTYRLFPYINITLGFILFIKAALSIPYS